MPIHIVSSAVNLHGSSAAPVYCTITGYGSTLYIGIAMVFVHFEIQFLLSISTFNDFTAQHMSKLSCVPNFSLKDHVWPKL